MKSNASETPFNQNNQDKNALQAKQNPLFGNNLEPKKGQTLFNNQNNPASKEST